MSLSIISDISKVLSLFPQNNYLDVKEKSFSMIIFLTFHGVEDFKCFSVDISFFV